MKKTNEKTNRILHITVCVLYIAVLVFAAEVLWGKYRDWLIVAVTISSFVICVICLIQEFDVSDAIETIEIQNEYLKTRAEIIRKQKEVLDRYDTAIVTLYAELERIDPENGRLTFVEDRLFRVEKNFSEK